MVRFDRTKANYLTEAVVAIAVTVEVAVVVAVAAAVVVAEKANVWFDVKLEIQTDLIMIKCFCLNIKNFEKKKIKN